MGLAVAHRTERVAMEVEFPLRLYSDLRAFFFLLFFFSGGGSFFLKASLPLLLCFFCELIKNMRGDDDMKVGGWGSVSEKFEVFPRCV